MTPEELEEKELEKTTGGEEETAGLIMDRHAAVDKQIEEGFIKCKQCGEKKPNMFKRQKASFNWVELYCYECKRSDKYSWNEISIG